MFYEYSQYLRSSCVLILPTRCERRWRSRKSIRSWRKCNQRLMNSVTAHEVSYLKSTPRLIEAPGNRLSKEMTTIDDVPFHSQLSILCDLVSWRKVKRVISSQRNQDCQTDMEESTLSAKNIYTCQQWSSIQIFMQNSRRDKDWASHWDKSRMYCRSSWTRSCRSFNKRPFDDILGADIKRKKPICEWNRRFRYQSQCQQQ